MTPFVPLVLKFLGLAGVGRRGGIALLIVGLVLMAPVAIPAIKAKIPFIGTEAKLKRAESKADDLQQQVAQLQSELTECVSANETNSATITALQNQITDNKQRIEAEQRERETIRAAYEAAEVARDQDRAQSARRLADAIRTSADQCATTPIPADILQCIRKDLCAIN